MTLVRICGLCPRKDYWKDRAEPMEIAETKVNIETTRDEAKSTGRMILLELAGQFPSLPSHEVTR